MKRILPTVFLFLFSFVSFSQISVDNNYPYNWPEYLVNEVLLSECIDATGIVYQGDVMQLGYFDASSSISGLPSININNGVILSSGDVNEIDPSFIGPIYNPLNIYTDPDLLNVANSVPPLLPSPYTNSFSVSGINDVASLSFDFVADTDVLTFNYAFGSSEYFNLENL